MLATMSMQHCRTLQVERFFRQCRMLLRHCCRSNEILSFRQCRNKLNMLLLLLLAVVDCWFQSGQDWCCQSFWWPWRCYARSKASPWSESAVLMICLSLDEWVPRLWFTHTLTHVDCAVKTMGCFIDGCTDGRRTPFWKCRLCCICCTASPMWARGSPPYLFISPLPYLLLYPGVVPPYPFTSPTSLPSTLSFSIFYFFLLPLLLA